MNLFVELHWMLIAMGMILLLMLPCSYFLMRASKHLSRLVSSTILVHTYVESAPAPPPSATPQPTQPLSQPESIPTTSAPAEPQFSPLPKELARKLTARAAQETSKPKRISKTSKAPPAELKQPFNKLEYLKSELESGRISPEFLSQLTKSPVKPESIPQIKLSPLIPPDSKSKLEGSREATSKLISKLELEFKRGHLSKKSFQELISKLKA